MRIFNIVARKYWCQLPQDNRPQILISVAAGQLPASLSSGSLQDSSLQVLQSNNFLGRKIPGMSDIRHPRDQTQRRGWDSNPRALSDKRFSRPPRYDRFDTSPSAAHTFRATLEILSAFIVNVNSFLWHVHCLYEPFFLTRAVLKIVRMKDVQAFTLQ